MPIRDELQADMVIIDELIDVRAERFAIRVPVTREVFANPDGRRAVAHDLRHHLIAEIRGRHRGNFAPLGVDDNAMQLADEALSRNWTYKALAEGRDPRAPLPPPGRLVTDQFQRNYLGGMAEELNIALDRQMLNGAHVNAAPNPRIFFENLDRDTTRGGYAASGGITWASTNANTRHAAPPPPVPTEAPCACGDRFTEDDEPNNAWTHGPDECVYNDRPVTEYVDHGAD